MDSTRIDLDSDIDLESGKEEVRKGKALGEENSKISGKVMSSESFNGRDSSSSYENLSSWDEIYYKSKAMQEEEMEMSVGNKERRKKQSCARPPRPHRPPRGPSFDTYDVKLIREISELNSKRRKMGRIRTFNKVKKHKLAASSYRTDLLACFLTMFFFLVIFLQAT